MANSIIIKKSSVGSKVPLATDLDYGELALNYTDGKLYYKKSDGTTIDYFPSSTALPGYVPLTGGTMTGKLILPAVTTTSAPINIGYASTATVPSSPVDGDVWISATNGMQFRYAGLTRTVPRLEGTNSFSGNNTFSSTVTVNASFTNTIASASFSVGATTQTTGTIAIGGNLSTSTGDITLGQSVGSQTLNLHTGATASAAIKTINLGTGGTSGSTTTINIGSAYGTTVTANGNWTFAGNAAVSGGIVVGGVADGWASSFKTIKLGSNTTLAGSSSGVQTILATNAYYDGYDWVRSSVGEVGIYQITGSNHYWIGASTGSAVSSITGTTLMQLTSGGALTVSGALSVGGDISSSGSNAYFSGWVFNLSGNNLMAGSPSSSGSLYVDNSLVLTGSNYSSYALPLSGGTPTGTVNFKGSNLTLQDPTDQTKQAVFSMSSIATATTRTYTLPDASGTVPLLSLAQTFSATQTFSAAVTMSGSTTNLSLGTSQSTGTWTAGGTAQTGVITLGRSTASQTTNIQAGATASGSTKTINFGTGGLTGSTTVITIGSTFGTSVVANGSWTFPSLITGSVSGNAATVTSITSSQVTTALSYTPENSANKNVANGYAGLDSSGLIPSTLLPSYVDDVLEYANLAGFPATGETGKIYVAKDTNKTYRWGGSSYVYITSGAVDSVAGKTGVVTLSSSDVGLGLVDNKSSATIRDELTSSNVTTALGFTPYNNTNPSGYISGNQTITLSGDLSGSGTTSISASLATSGVTAGTYTNANITVDAKGRITLASNGSSAVSSFNTRTGDITLSSADVTTALGFTPLSNATSYLPLSGGTLTGSVNFATSYFTLQDSTDATKRANFSISGNTTAVTRTYTLPDSTGTIALLGLAQTFSAAQTFSSTVTASSTITLSGSTSSTTTLGTSATTGTLTAGGTSQTGTMTLGRSTVSQQTDIQAGVTASGSTKTINFGTGGASGSTTNINIGPVLGTGTIAANGAWTFSGSTREQRQAMAANDIDLKLANYFTKTIAAATTFTVSNVPASGTAASFILDLTNGGSFTITWWTGVKWANGTAPVLTATGRDVLAFFTHDAGTTWTGLLVGKDVK